jgi:serine/threonine-protein phosphatase 6 regulatory ankyrin repeat subunit B
MSSIESGDAEMVRALIDAGADVHAKSHFGHTALGDAILTGQTEIARVLKEAGATE